MLWRMCADLHRERIGSMAFFVHPAPATNVSATNVFRRPKWPALIALIALTLRKGSVLGRKLAADQRRGEIAPGESHFLDIDAGHGVDPIAHPLAAQPLVEEAARIGRQHPQHGGVAALGTELAEPGAEQPPS